MSTNDVELIQSFVRRYINKEVKAHFSDVSGDDDSSLSLNAPRSAIKRICLHKDADPIMLTVIRLLFWWIEAKRIGGDIIYGIPNLHLHESQKFKPQIQIHWRESNEDAKSQDRYPLRAIYTIRWKGAYASKTDIERMRAKVNLIFNKTIPHSFYKGKEKWSYYDDEKGYRLIITARDRSEAVEVINSLLEIQGDNPLNVKYLKVGKLDDETQSTETIRVGGETFKLPKTRQTGKVSFTHAEFKVHGMPEDILLVSNLTSRVPTRLQ